MQFGTGLFGLCRDLRRTTLALGVVFCLASFDEPPTPTKAAGDALRFGMSTVLTGPAADLGKQMSEGVRSAFEEQNRAGGIGGQKLELVILDDGYEPVRVVPNIRRLLVNESVLGIVGNVGTPTAIAAVPITNEAQTLFFGALTGAGMLRKDPPDRCVINYRASYAEETAAMVDALIEHGGLLPEEIAVFSQRDGYGDSGFKGARTALLRHGLKESARVLHVRYERNTLDIEGALAEILLARTPPRAVIMVGTYKPCAKFVTLARSSGLESLFLNVSFVGTSSFGLEAGPAADGVIITQVVPHYLSEEPLVMSFRAALEQCAPCSEPSFASLEGYIAGRILCRALEGAQPPLTRQGVVEALEALGVFDLGLGFELRLDATQHQASHRVWPTRFENGVIREFNWNDLPRRGGV